ncbi:hypothetical protein QQX98_011271 [Neonectria punicea]|uniref:SNTX MACPF/CDC-like domain-containing protein n=1 Tax=Neonectria punicea TaxID=979145 RepID=A0ABR1GM52_9HYPO
MISVVRGAFGQVASIGTLYDATREQFLRTSIRDKLPPGAISTLRQPNTDIFVIPSGTYSQKFEALGVKEEGAASVLAGLVEPRGSGAYLRHGLGTTTALHGAVCHKVSTVQERLGFAGLRLMDHVDLTSPIIQRGTHVVTSIDWGMQTIVAMKHCLPDNVDRAHVEAAFQRDLDVLSTAVASVGGGYTNGMDEIELELELTLYTDALQDEGLIIQDLAEVVNFIRIIPDHISHGRGGKGWQLFYTLLPLSMLQLFYPGVGAIGATSIPANPESLSKVVHLFNDFAVCEDQLSGYAASLEGRERHVADGHIASVATSIHLLQQSKK